MSNVVKQEGETKKCESCGDKITVRMSAYSGSYANKLQWQNEDGTAHYKWIGTDKYECVRQKEDSTQKEVPKQTIQEPPSFPGVNVVPKKIIDYHNNAWEIALMKAHKVYQNENGSEKKKSTYILAQVFYKGLMGITRND